MPAVILAIVLAIAPAPVRGDMTALERALAADPESLRLAADYRQLAIAAKDFDRAIDFLEKLARRSGAGPNVHLSLALAYVDKVPTSGDIRRLYLGRDAMNALTKSIERQPSVLAYYIRGQINLYYNNFIFKRIPRGIEDLKSALELVTPSTPAVLAARVFASMGDGYWRLDDRARACEVWAAGAARYPDDEVLKRRLDPDAEKIRRVVSASLNASTRVDTTLDGVVPR